MVSKIEDEKRTVAAMIRIYCKHEHGTKCGLCPECDELRRYAEDRSDECPYKETKSFYTKCETHCYRPAMRERILKVMRFAGPRMIYHHPRMAIRYAIDSRKQKNG